MRPDLRFKLPCCRSLGKGPLAATHLLTAQEVVEQQLAALRINMEVRAQQLGHRGAWQDQ